MKSLPNEFERIKIKPDGNGTQQLTLFASNEIGSPTKTTTFPVKLSADRSQIISGDGLTSKVPAPIRVESDDLMRIKADFKKAETVFKDLFKDTQRQGPSHHPEYY